MITILKNTATPVFARVDNSGMILTGFGRMIQREIINFNRINSSFKILQYVVMPDHIHILIFIQNTLPEVLGYYIARWKIEVNKVSETDRVFHQGFNDQILHKDRSLKVLINYIRDNPRRLVVRRAYPDFFRRLNNLTVGGIKCRAYGNIQLLDNPFKEQVVVHRSDSQATRRHNRDLWLYTAANGGVLVSPFISKEEKAVRSEAEALGGKLILITSIPMRDRYKPSARDFSLCEQGRLLIISAEGLGSALSRTVCLQLNSLAKAITDSRHVVRSSQAMLKSGVIAGGFPFLGMLEQ